MVLITAERSTGKTIKLPDAEGGAQIEEKVQYIPDRYNTKSELTVELAGGENTKDFALEAGGGGSEPPTA